ncbi:MAG: thiolase family protein [Candidatus Binatia bacterium]
MAEVYVIGVGFHPFGRFPDSTFEDLTRVAVSRALEDAGVSFPAVEAAFIGNVSSGLYDARRVIQQFGWTGIPITRLVQASASGSAAFREAYLMLAHEVWQVALVVGFEKMERGLLPGSLAVMTGQRHLDVMGLDAIPARVALEMKKRMERFGESAEMFAQVAVQASGCAALNPNAHYRVRHSIQEVLQSRMISEPLTLYQCCPNSDGAAAVILCNSTKARQFGLNRAVRVAGWASGSPDYTDYVGGPGSDIGGDFKGQTLTRRLVRTAYERAGVGPEDIRVAQVHDPFTLATLVDIESLGFCQEGEAGQWFMAGKTQISGKVAINTDGGLLCKGHPLGASGVAQIAEIACQLRGEAGPRQVPGSPRLGLTQSSGAGMVNIHIFQK